MSGCIGPLQACTLAAFTMINPAAVAAAAAAARHPVSCNIFIQIKIFYWLIQNLDNSIMKILSWKIKSFYLVWPSIFYDTLINQFKITAVKSASCAKKSEMNVSWWDVIYPDPTFQFNPHNLHVTLMFQLDSALEIVIAWYRETLLMIPYKANNGKVYG